MDQGFKAAKLQWEQCVSELAKGSLVEQGPWVVAYNIPQLVYDEWVRAKESRWRLAWQPTAPDCSLGTVVFYGDPTEVHEQAAGWFSLQVAEQLIVQGVGCKAIQFCFSTTYALPDGTRKEPDASFKPKHLPLDSLPTVAVEVAYTNESAGELRDEVRRWSLAGAHALGVKIFSGAEPKLAFLHAPPNIASPEAIATVQFGKGSDCTAPDQVVVSVPWSTLFGGSEHVPQALRAPAGAAAAGGAEDGAHGLRLDLFELQTIIHDTLTRRR